MERDINGNPSRARAVDDRGERFPIVQNVPANCLGVAPYTEVFRVRMERARYGQLVMSMDQVANGNTAVFVNVWLDIHVVGWCGAAGQIVDSFTLDRFGLADFQWDEPDSYEALSIDAQMSVNGIIQSTIPTGLLKLNLNVSGAYWR